MTEHRDPYSFYWQLDQVKPWNASHPHFMFLYLNSFQQRRRSESPKRHPPPTDYVIDEEEVSQSLKIFYCKQVLHFLKLLFLNFLLLRFEFYLVEYRSSERFSPYI
ncbi:unnamed protein product [Strongylus vulgaris]|uniref:Uncharacterized protein n=1 Tax=Strongylus vulgaris TaxID=40348 RepID=A0A3P7JY69_STRVU|nr:unnamed protein product [Strongylus vulgaris]